MKEDVIVHLTRVLENDASFTDSSANQRAMEIVENIGDQRKIDLSPRRYGVIRQEADKTMLSIFEKGHNFYDDPVIDEIDITALQGRQST